MLRPFGAGDIPEYAELYRKYFPDESALLLADAGAFQRVIARMFQWDARLIFGFLRAIGRPIGHFFALEVDGTLAGVTFLLFDGGVGYIASVAVDARFRRRGYARQLMAAAEAAAARRGCRYTVLDVIESNLPAIQLYKSMEYHPIRRVGWYYRDLGGANPPLPDAPKGAPGPVLRPFRRSDGEVLAEIARSRQPSLERSVRPTRPSAFSVPPLLTRALGGATRAFVLVDPAGRPDGFVRSSSSTVVGSGNMVVPMVGPQVSEERALGLLDHGLAWFRDHPVRRIICEVPEDDRSALVRLGSRGFQRGLGLETLAKSL
jgi:ribosomal protein S18 acetylase RimI-like enzyme